MFSYVRRFSRPDLFDGAEITTRTRADFKGMRLSVDVGGETVASDEMTFEADGTRNLVARLTLADGRTLEIESGYISWWSTGIAARVDGEIVHESHPGEEIEWPSNLAFAPAGADAAERAEAAKAEAARMKRNTPSLIVDFGLGLLFFFVARATDLTTAAVVGVIAGVALLIVQRFVKRWDLLGGLALFGIAIMAVSAAYALIVQDEELIKLRSTIIGSGVALLFLTDGLVFKGRYLGARIGRFFPGGGIAWRAAIGVGLIGLVMALANLVVVRLVSTDVWLWYTTFGDTILAIGLGVALSIWASAKPGTASSGSAAPGAQTVRT